MKNQHFFRFLGSVISLCIAVMLGLQSQNTAHAATLMSDSFTGTTIDSSLWDIVDPAGTNITQNNALTVKNSYSGGNWGQTSLNSKQTFSRTDLSISAVMTAGSAQLLGYGDYNFQNPASSAYMIDISTPGNGATIFALVWSGGGVSGNMSCGTATNGAKYTLKVTATGFEVYKDTGSGDVLLCSTTGATTMTNKKVFLQAENSSGGVFDDLLVADASAANTVPAAISNLSASSGNTQVSLAWSAPNNGGQAITDYLIDYRSTASPSWTTFVDGTSTATTTTVTGLTNGTEYGFRVRAVNSIGTANDSNIASSTPMLPTAPSAPTSVSAVAGNTTAVVSFTPGSANGSAITGYTVTSSPGGITATGGSSPITVTGLTNGQAYTFTVTATNGVGTSVSSASSNSVTPTQQVPLSISGLALWLDASDASTVTSSSGFIAQIDDKSGNNNHATATGIIRPEYIANVQNGNSVMRFDGTNHYLNISKAIGYRTMFVVAKFDATQFNSYNGIIGDITGTSPNNGHIVNGVQSTSKIAVATSNYANAYRNGYLISGSGGHDFSPLNEFWLGSFELSANATNTTSAIGAINGEASRKWDGDIAEVLVYNKTLSTLERTNLETYFAEKWGLTVATPPAAPSAISTLSASTTGPSNVVLTWTAPASNGSSITDYLIDYRTVGAGSWTSFSDGTSVATTTTVTSLSASTAYQFRVRAVNGIGTANDSNIATATTSNPTVPSAPTIGTAVAGNGQAFVYFTTPASTGGSAIQYYTAVSSPGGITATGTSSPITVTGLTNGQAYTFTVTATNGVGASSASSASNSVTPEVIDVPAQVTGLTAFGANKRVNLKWSIPYDGGDAAIIDYLVEYKATSSATWLTFVDGATTTPRATVTGLTNGQGYDFRVSAMNAGGTGTASTATSSTPRAITTLSFVITGESNSGGIGSNSSATSGELAPRSSVQIMNLTSGSFLFETMDIGVNNLRDHAGLSGYYDNSHGLELQLANSVEAHAFPDNPQVYLTKTGQGGSQVSQWNVGGGYWNKFLERTASAKAQLPADRQWVVWLSLGINDAIAGVATSTWKTAMIAHINKIKADLPNAIVIMTEFQSMTAGSGYPTYNAVMRELVSEMDNVYSVDSTGAAIADGNHWSYAGLKTVASRMVDVTKNTLGLIYPGMPTSLSATPASNQVALSWTAPVSNGGSSITDYIVEYKTTDASTWSTFVDGTGTTPSATVTGLTSGVPYNFRVSAASAIGAGNYASTVSTTTDSTSPTISAVSATAGTSSVIITWNTDESASSMVDYGLTSAFGTTTVEINTSPRVTSHSVTISGLTSCVTYYYRVRSRDASANTGTSTSALFTTDDCVGSADVQNATSSAVTATLGGEVGLSSGGAGIAIQIPGNATAGDVVYQIKALDPTQTQQAIGAPTGLRSSTLYFDLKAITASTTFVTSFNQPLSITFTYTNADISNLNESSLVIYRYDGSMWSPLSNCVVDSGANTITCNTSNFSIFSIFGAEGGAGSPVSVATPVRYGCTDSKAINYDATARMNQSLCRYSATAYQSHAGGQLFILEPGAPTMQGTSTKNTSITPSFVFTRSLSLGLTHPDVKELQKTLNRLGYAVAKTGLGSLGNETNFFGRGTQAAVIRFQKEHNIQPAFGFFGPLTRAAVMAKNK